MVVIPGFPHDQAPNSRAVEDWGAGRALAGDADAAAIREAAGTILSDPRFRDAARLRAAAMSGPDGARAAAAAVEAMGSAHPEPAH